MIFKLYNLLPFQEKLVGVNIKEKEPLKAVYERVKIQSRRCA